MSAMNALSQWIRDTLLGMVHALAYLLCTLGLPLWVPSNAFKNDLTCLD